MITRRECEAEGERGMREEGEDISREYKKSYNKTILIHRRKKGTRCRNKRKTRWEK